LRIISLNLWAGKVLEPLTSFLKQTRDATDIYCFQEVFNHPSDAEMATNPIKEAVPGLYGRLLSTLNGFEGHLSASHSSFGQRMAIFTSKGISVQMEGDITLCELEDRNFAGKQFKTGSGMQWVKFIKDRSIFTVANVHGLWTPDGKKDIPQRIQQSERIIDFFYKQNGPKILCGDFNLLPTTQSVRIIDSKFINLIKKYRIKTTRSRLSNPVAGKFADYMFVSEGVEVRDFKVLEDVVSDHLPLSLEFEVDESKEKRKEKKEGREV